MDLLRHVIIVTKNPNGSVCKNYNPNIRNHVKRNQKILIRE
ncbi:hypothetical protein D778_00319 [Xanthomarina gelatinilytica]|uniref:Uncharacterized protein n=1 Tax=Xanthomarina gelatinilytica TaxID=1137281 RepID=M7MZN2_9FLAO|nr:hypothetical protein D778_00319 [Xanthomarina gelatinilytica]